MINLNEEDAKDAAKELAERLGPDWTPRHYENLSWFAEARYKNGGMLYVTAPAYGSKTYTAFLQSTRQFVSHDIDPREAVFNVRDMLERHISDSIADHRALKDCLKKCTHPQS